MSRRILKRLGRVAVAIGIAVAVVVVEWTKRGQAPGYETQEEKL